MAKRSTPNWLETASAFSGDAADVIGGLYGVPQAEAAARTAEAQAEIVKAESAKSDATNNTMLTGFAIVGGLLLAGFLGTMLLRR